MDRTPSLDPGATKPAELARSRGRGTPVWLGRAFLTLSLLWAANAPGQIVPVDPDFPAGAGPNAVVRSVAIQPDGQVLVGGYFTNLNDSPRLYIARIGISGLVDQNFAPQLNAEASRIQPLADGRILISGSFSMVNGVARPGLARLEADGALDSAFVPPGGLSTGGPATGWAAADQTVWVTGMFASVGGLPSNRIGRLLSDGAVDSACRSPFGPGDTVAIVAIQPDGKPLVAGAFSNLAGVLITNLARLNLDGSVDHTFRPALAPGERVMRGILMPDGSLVGVVAVVADFGLATTPPRLARFGPDGALDPEFKVVFESPGFPYNGAIHSLALQPDGNLLLSGTFLRVNGVARGKIARLRTDGTVDFCFEVPFGGEWTPLAVASGLDGSVYVGGSFGGLQGQAHPHLLRLLPPPHCDPGVIEMAVPVVQAREDALRVIIPVARRGATDLEQSVEFTTRDGTAQAGRDYEPTTGTVRFARGERSRPIEIVVRNATAVEGGKTFEVLLTKTGGDAVLGNTTNTQIVLTDARPGAAGAPDTNFVVKLDGPVRLAVGLTQGRALIAGSFTNINGQFSPSLAIMDAGGHLERSLLHSRPLAEPVTALAVDAGEGLLVSGSFQRLDGAWRPGLARFDYQGNLDDSFQPFALWPTNDCGGVQVQAVTVLPDGQIVCSATLPGPGCDTSTQLLRLSREGRVQTIFTNVGFGEVRARKLQAAPGGGFFLLGRGLGSTLARLRANAELDWSFQPPADRQSTFYSGDFNLLPDGRVMMSALANAFDGLISVGPLWRLNPDGSLDASFHFTNTASAFGILQSADAISAAADGRVLVAGYFSNGDNSRRNLRRLLPDGSIDWSFDPGSGITAVAPGGLPAVYTLAALPDGGWLAGGDFGGYNGFNQRYLVKVLPESSLIPRSFTLDSTNVSLVESSDTLVFEIRRHGDASTPAGVTVLTQDGTALAGADYLPLHTNLLFAAGEWSKTVSVVVLDDEIVEGTEQFRLCLTNPTSGFSLGNPSSITITIQDNDAGIEFSQNQFLAVEEDGFALLSARWSGAVSSRLRAQIRIFPLDGSEGVLGVAHLAVQYGSGTRVGTNTFYVPVADDEIHQPRRHFRLELSGGEGLIAGPRSNALLVLDDRDFSTTPARGIAGVVEALASAPSGGVYLAGEFSSVHGVRRPRVARLLPDGLVDLNFDPGQGPDAKVTALAVQRDGRVLIAGSFASVAGTPRAGLARMNADGSLDASFAPGAGIQSTNGPAFARVLLPARAEGIWVAGAFTHYDEFYSPHLIKLLPDGRRDTNFISPFRGPNISPWPRPPAGASSAVYSLVEQPDGGVVAAGSFNLPPTWPSINYTTASVVRMHPQGALDLTFTNNLSSSTAAYSLARTSEGKLLVGGECRSHWIAIWRLEPNGTSDRTFRILGAPPVAFITSRVQQLILQADGKILFSATLFGAGPGDPGKAGAQIEHTLIGRLLPDGMWDASFGLLDCELPLLREAGPYWFNNTDYVRTLGAEPIVPTAALAAQSDGMLVLAGAFDRVNGEPRRRLARVNPNGTLRGKLLLELSQGHPLRLSLPPEVESPYVLEVSSDLRDWSEWMTDNYPWWPVSLRLDANDPARFFRARPVFVGR